MQLANIKYTKKHLINLIIGIAASLIATYWFNQTTNQKTTAIQNPDINQNSNININQSSNNNQNATTSNNISVNQKQNININHN